MKSDELEVELESAKDEFSRITKESNARLTELKDSAQRVHSDEGWPTRLGAANTKVWEIEHKLQDVRFAEASELHKDIIGRKVWKTEGRPLSRYSRLTKDIKVFGVVEVWGPNSERRDNLTGRSPRHGTMVVRLLKKDGKPSKDFGWLAEGFVVRDNSIGLLIETKWSTETHRQEPLDSPEYRVAWTFVVTEDESKG